MGQTVDDFKNLITVLNQAMTSTNVTNGFIVMPKSLQDNFISVVGDLADSMNKTANDFIALSVNIQALQSAVSEENPDSGICFVIILHSKHFLFFFQFKFSYTKHDFL